jgi:5-(carboxyamino)imidazole ribonucleotide synthase
MTYDIGYLGGGQLARMSIQAASRMGLTALSLDPGEVTPASLVAPALQGRLDDPEAIRRIFDLCEFVTLENEFIPAVAIRTALEGSRRSSTVLVPGVDALATIQDKLHQKQALMRHGVPTSQAADFGGEFSSFPFVLKARFGGYDGKGTLTVRNEEELEATRPVWSSGGWMVEEYVRFKRELAVMVAISGKDRIAFPTVETVQTDHVCDLVYPADLDASSIAFDAIDAIGGQGLYGVELFETLDGDLLVNEIAPRPHNTGHYTLDWGGPSQFEAHIRAVMGMTQVEPRSESFAVMANLLGQPGAGDFRPAVRAALEVPGAFVHWYGKAESRPGRKMGHINVAGSRGPIDDAVERAREARRLFYQAWCAQ